jgi:hypothetical protein
MNRRPWSAAAGSVGDVFAWGDGSNGGDVAFTHFLSLDSALLSLTTNE